jgi:hypothetical protein
MNLTTHNIVSPRNAHAYAFHLPFLSYRQLLTANCDWRRIAALSTLLAAMVTASLLAGTPPPAQAADICPNAVQRAQNHSSDLPDCRAYEMVSSPYKEGFAVEPRRFTDDGIVSYFSLGNFAGSGLGSQNLYHAERSAAGWVTTAPSPSNVVYTTGGGTVAAESPDLRSAVWVMHRRDSSQVTDDIYVRNPAGDFIYAGHGATTECACPSPGVVGTSADLSHIVFNYGSSGGAVTSALREYVGTGNGGLPRAVSIDNNGNPTPAETCPNTTSNDGRVIVYTSGCHIATPQLWARVAGSATVAVSGSECTRTAGDSGGACNGPSTAVYAGAADDGSRVLFTTSQQLVNADTDTGSDLYACDISPGSPAPIGAANPCASLTEVSGTTSDARVESVTAVSDDGSRVYFVAQGVLADNLGVGDQGAVAGTDQVPRHNLYLWERDAAYPAGHTRFITSLDADDLARAQMTPDTRYLTFLTSSALVTTGPGADTDRPCPACPSARDVYRYDSLTDALVRISTSTSGDGGNNPAYDAGSGTSGLVAWMTDDGAAIAFETEEGLSPDDTDGTTDVYMWHDGHVSLISSGGAELLWISPSGRDIYFQTEVALVAGDRDVISDIYDARVDGGFDVPQTTLCSGDGCQGQQSSAPGLLGRASSGSLGQGSAEASPGFSLQTVSVAQRKRLAATGKLVLTVSTNTAGTFSARATAAIGGRSVTVASGHRTLTAPGKVTLPLTLSRKARAQLAARGRLGVKVTVGHSKVALDRSVTLALTHTKVKAKRKPVASSHARRATVSNRGQS